MSAARTILSRGRAGAPGHWAQLAVYCHAVLKQAFDTKDTATVEIFQLVDDIRIGPFGTMLLKSDYVSGGIPVINPLHI